MTNEWTAECALPGGDFPVDGVTDLQKSLQNTYAFLTDSWALRLVRAYGRDAFDVYGDAKKMGDLGKEFGATLFAREVDWLIAQEWARTSDDVIWRRTKLGLRLDALALKHLDEYMRDATKPPQHAERAIHG